MLFATEAFESFNAVIHAKVFTAIDKRLLVTSLWHLHRVTAFVTSSVEGISFRPISMPLGRRIRMSHCLWLAYSWGRSCSPYCYRYHTFKLSWAQNIGPFCHWYDFPSLHLHFNFSLIWPLGQCKQDKQDPWRFPQTLNGVKLPGIFQSSPASARALYITSTRVNLLNGNDCVVGQHVIIQRHSGSALVDNRSLHVFARYFSKLDLQIMPTTNLTSVTANCGTRWDKQ